LASIPRALPWAVMCLSLRDEQLKRTPAMPESVGALRIEPSVGALRGSPDFRLWMLDLAFLKDTFAGGRSRSYPGVSCYF
jgi:hypothetical protein